MIMFNPAWGWFLYEAELQYIILFEQGELKVQKGQSPKLACVCVYALVTMQT